MAILKTEFPANVTCMSFVDGKHVPTTNGTSQDFPLPNGAHVLFWLLTGPAGSSGKITITDGPTVRVAVEKARIRADREFGYGERPFA